MKYYIVWNEDKSEGFITNEYQLAYEVRKGAEHNCYYENKNDLALTARAFCDQTCNENCTIQEIEL